MQGFLTIADAAKLIATKQLSPVELTRICLDRIRNLDATLHSFLLVTEDRAIADAKAAEARMMSAKTRGPLDGIPIGHKDIYNTAGIRTTGHSRLLEHNTPDEDAVVVSKWAGAGTVLMGKLATHEFAIGGPSFDLPWPPARNPWNPAHFTSGSSSGTGAAVAAGLVLGGTGSDTGGSIRGPSALCGLAGIKPTYGLCSRRGVLPLSQTLDHTGPMAWTVQDCALLLQAMAGHDPLDPASADRAVPDFTADLEKGVKGLRIGVIRHFHEVDNPISPATKQGIEDALNIFRDPRRGNPRRHAVADDGLQRAGLADPDSRGLRSPRTLAEVALQRLWRAVAGPPRIRRPAASHGLRPGHTPAARVVPGDGQCHGRPRCPDHRVCTCRGPEDRRGAEMGDAGEAEFHHAVQPDRAAGPECLHRLWRRRPAGQYADRRQTVRRANGFPGRTCLRDGNHMAKQAANDGGSFGLMENAR
jgi:hypothetical protein